MKIQNKLRSKNILLSLTIGLIAVSGDGRAAELQQLNQIPTNALTETQQELGRRKQEIEELFSERPTLPPSTKEQVKEQLKFFLSRPQQTESDVPITNDAAVLTDEQVSLVKEIPGKAKRTTDEKCKCNTDDEIIHLLENKSSMLESSFRSFNNFLKFSSLLALVDFFLDMNETEAMLTISITPGLDILQRRGDTEKVLRSYFQCLLGNIPDICENIQIYEIEGEYDHHQDIGFFAKGKRDLISALGFFVARLFHQDSFILSFVPEREKIRFFERRTGNLFILGIVSKIINNSGNIIDNFDEVQISTKPLKGPCTTVCLNDQEKVNVKFCEAPKVSFSKVPPLSLPGSNRVMPKSKSLSFLSKIQNEGDDDREEDELFLPSISQRPSSPTATSLADAYYSLFLKSMSLSDINA